MKKWNYYNDSDPKVCAWARELIKAGLVPDGEVDCRSLTDVAPSDIKGFTQCHFFCGVLGWSLALRLAGWPDDRPVWTGSCPCQPFSVAGKGKGTEDERHLWPIFAKLIRACNPATVFGEQVASKAGREWLAGVFADLEGMDYQRAAADLCSPGVGAPHIRQRLYWMAHHHHQGSQGRERGELPERAVELTAGPGGACGGVADAFSTDVVVGQGAQWGAEFDGRGAPRRLVQPNGDGRETGSPATTEPRHGGSIEPAGFWSDSQLIPCRDGKTRRIPTESAFFPLASGVPARVVRLRGYGNAIVPQVAAQFILASEEALWDERLRLSMNDPAFL